MSYEITGKITHISDAKSGTTRDGRTWENRTAVVEETGEQYPSQAAITFFNDRLHDLCRYQVGDLVTVHFNMKVNESGGRHFQNLTAWKIEADAPQQASQAPPPPHNPGQAPPKPEDDPAYQQAKQQAQAPPQSNQETPDLPF